MSEADEIIARLNLAPHPEGGYYRETWRAPTRNGKRATATAIYFLLKEGKASHWHKVDAAEIWFYHAGAPLELRISDSDQGPAKSHRLDATTPQVLVPQDHWQAAATTGAYTLVSCVVSPGFDFAGFTLAPPEFTIPE